MLPPRTIAIGDIHGCSRALDAVLDAIAPAAEDTIITLGDYVDRGPDSRGVLDRLIALDNSCRLVPILGNHDQMLLDALADRRLLRPWLEFGGAATLASYGGRPGRIPPAHLDFLAACRDFHEDDTHIFVHAGYVADLPMAAQPPAALRWQSLREQIPAPHRSGKTVIAGHTSQKTGEVLDLGYLKCIDTYCYGGGWLTALEVATGRTWQAGERGGSRPGPTLTAGAGSRSTG